MGLRFSKLPLHLIVASAVWAAKVLRVLSPSINAANITGEAQFLSALTDHRHVRVSKGLDTAGKRKFCAIPSLFSFRSVPKEESTASIRL